MSVTVLIASSPVSIFSGDHILISDKEANTSTAQFTVWDAPGTATFTQNMVVTITDSVYGLQFGGYIDSAQPELLNPTVSKKWIIICKDKTYLPGKRQVLQPDFTGTLAGDAVTDLHGKYLAAEGITANYVLDHDTDTPTFGAGTLVGTSASSGDLALSLAGTTFTKTETTTADFNTGTLTNVVGVNNSLQLVTTPAMKLVGTAAANINSNPNAYVVFSTTAITINTGDRLLYDIFISSTSPAIASGIQMVFTDGSTLRDTTAIGDQYGVSANPKSDLSGYAKDQWYHRDIALNNTNVTFVGKTTLFFSFGLEGDAVGNYASYIRNVTIQTSGGTVRTTLFSTTLSMNQLNENAAYYGIKLSVVNTFNDTGQRVSPAYSIASPGIVKNSLITWTTPAYTQLTANTSTYGPPLLIESSFDSGATWQPCTNHGQLPNVVAGFSTASQTLLLRQTLSLAGPSPEIAPILNDCTITITPSYSATKSDVRSSHTSSADFATGTLTNVQYATNKGEQITGAYSGWADGSILNNPAGGVTGQTTFGSSGSNPIASVSQGTLEIRAGLPSLSFISSRFDFAGQWQNFILEMDVLQDTSSAHYPNILYRTTGWQNVDDTYAYTVQFTPTQVQLFRGTNTSSGSGAGTNIGNSPVYAFTSGQYYHFKLVVNGSSHIVYLNGLQVINSTDATWSAAGYVGVRMWNNTTLRQSCFYANFGIMSSAFVGTRVHSSLSLAGLGNVQTSLMQWNATTPGATTVLVETSTDGGATYLPCTNGAVIPQLTTGTNTSGLSLLIRETLSTQNANSTPTLAGITALVVGNYTATGTRVSPTLSIGSVGRVGSTSITWTSAVPTGTALVVEESLIGATGPWTTATNGGPIPTITAQPVSVSDGFTALTSANYTSTNYSGGSNATWTFDTANSRLTATNGTNGLYVWNQVNAKDVQVDANLNQAANAGLIWRYSDVNNFYFAIISDASSGTNPNTIKIYKRAASVTSGVLATGAITFTRGTYHTFRVVMSATSITAYFDGVSVTSITDASIGGPGSVGFLQSSTTQTNWYSIRGQQLGDDVTGKSVWTRLTLTSTDPTLTPAVTDLVTSVRGQQLMSGGSIGVQKYQYQMSVMGALSDIAGKCPGYTVGITDTGALTFQSHAATPANWPLASTNSSLINGQQIGDIQWSTPPTLVKQSPLYRNRSIIVGGMDVTALIPDTRMGDGFTQTWELAYPVALAPAITLNGQPVAVGVQGVDTGMNFYYQIGSTTISQDVSATPIASTDMLLIPYYGQITVVKQSDNVSQQSILAALEGGTSGIVEVVEHVDGLSASAAQAMADARVAQYAILSQAWTFTTLRPGLKSGQLLQVFVPEYGLADILMLITQVDQVIIQGGSDSSTLTFYTVTCNSGPNVGDWTTLYV